METTRPPGFPGNPPARMPRAPTPARSPPPRPLRRGEMTFRPTHDVGPRTQCISGLNYAAYGLPVNASRPGSPQAHASLGSDWRPTLAGWDWIPTGFRTRFRRSHHVILSPLTGLSRHTHWSTDQAAGPKAIRASRPGGGARGDRGGRCRARGPVGCETCRARLLLERPLSVSPLQHLCTHAGRRIHGLRPDAGRRSQGGLLLVSDPEGTRELGFRAGCGYRFPGEAFAWQGATLFWRGCAPHPTRTLRGDPEGPTPRPRGAHVRALV